MKESKFTRVQPAFWLGTVHFWQINLSLKTVAENSRKHAERQRFCVFFFEFYIIFFDTSRDSNPIILPDMLAGTEESLWGGVGERSAADAGRPPITQHERRIESAHWPGSTHVSRSWPYCHIVQQQRICAFPRPVTSENIQRDGQAGYNPKGGERAVCGSNILA